MAQEELRERIQLAAERVRQLIRSGWTADQVITVRKVFLDCFGTFDRIDKDPQTDLYHAVEGAFGKVGVHNPAQATMNHRDLSETQVQASTEFLSDLELYYAEQHTEPAQKPESSSTEEPTPPITGTLVVALDDATIVAEAVLTWKHHAFISYASEDQTFVRQLAERLRERELRVWVDQTELTVGDSLRGKIDEGLRSAEYGIVILSDSFFSKPWPQSELDALVELQNERGRKVILPVWLGVDAAAVRSHSPLLASRLAARSSEGMDKVISDLLRVLRPENGG